MISIWLYEANGHKIQLIDDYLSVKWIRAINDIGWFEIELPVTFNMTLIQVDGIIEIWRNPAGGKKYVEFAGFIRYIKFSTDKDGIETALIAGPDINELVKRRIIAYASGTAQGTHTDNSDDILLALIRENLGASAIAERNLTALGLSINADQGKGNSQTFSCAWDDLPGALEDLAKSAAAGGIALFWNIVPLGECQFKVYSYTTVPGMDRTGKHPVIFGLEWGNLSEPELTLDYTDEVTHVYAGGKGVQSAREIVEVSSAARTSRSPWGRREAFVDARNETDTAAITALANARLEKGKPRLKFTGTLLDTEQAVYGFDWNFGDRVKISYHRQQFSVLVVAMEGEHTQDGEEIIQAFCEVDDVISD